MDKKRLLVKSCDVDQYIARYMRFGWKVEDKVENGDKTTLYLLRDEHIPNYKNVKKMEKQYWQLQQKFPFGLVFWVVLGTVCLVLRLTIEFPYNDLLWFGMALCYCLAVYHLILFIIISHYRRKLLDALKDYSQTTLGLKPDLPYEVNIEAPTEYTGLIEQNYKR